jgi:hypothetical protein
MSTLAQAALDPAISAIRDGILAGLAIVGSLIAAIIVVRMSGTGWTFQARLQIAVLLAVTGSVTALGLMAYLQGAAMASFLGVLVGYVCGVRPDPHPRDAERQEPPADPT